MTEHEPPEGGPAAPDAKASEPSKPPRPDADRISALQEAPAKSESTATTGAPPPPPHGDRTKDTATGDAKAEDAKAEDAGGGDAKAGSAKTPTDDAKAGDAPAGDKADGKAGDTTTGAGEPAGDKGAGAPPPVFDDDDDDSPFLPLPDITAKPALDDDERARRRLLLFIVGGSVAAVLLLVVALVLILKPADSSLSSTPTTTKSQASLVVVPSGTVPEGTTVSFKINLISTQSFRSAIVTVDGQKVAQTSSPTEALTFTPPNGKHVAVGRVTLQSGEEVMTAPVEFTVGATAGTTPGTTPASPPTSASPPSSDAPTTASTAAPPTTPPTTAAGGPIEAAGLSADGALPLVFGDSVDRATTVFPGEAPDSKCAPIAPTYTGGKQFTFFGFPGGKFSYFLTQDTSMSTVEGAKVGMSVEEVKKLVPGLTEKTNAAGVPLLVKKSASGSSELVFFIAADKVLFIAGSTGDLAESKQC